MMYTLPQPHQDTLVAPTWDCKPLMELKRSICNKLTDVPLMSTGHWSHLANDTIRRIELFTLPLPSPNKKCPQRHITIKRIDRYPANKEMVDLTDLKTTRTGLEGQTASEKVWLLKIKGSSFSTSITITLPINESIEVPSGFTEDTSNILASQEANAIDRLFNQHTKALRR
jgi:hypothetical protein